MVRGSPGTSFTGSALVRLLARLAEADAPASTPPFAERLSQWLGWTDAISLSSALSTAQPAPPTGTPPARQRATAPAGDEAARLRTTLMNAIADDFPVPAAPTRRPAPARGEARAADPDDGFAPWRRRYAAKQQAMETSIGALRGRLRATLAGASPEMARLAAVDAVMEQVVGAQEEALLASVPRWLEKRFEHLRRVHHKALADTQAEDDPAAWLRPGGWLHRLGQDMQAALVAELDIRMQPVEGLAQALRGRSNTSPR